jgi:hypothetical protein
VQLDISRQHFLRDPGSVMIMSRRGTGMDNPFKCPVSAQ